MGLLEDRIKEFDLIDKPDWEVAEILNKPDPSLPDIVTLKSRQFGVGTILEIFGSVAGPAFLENLETLSNVDPLIKWSLVLLRAATLDAASPMLRDAVDHLIATNVISAVHGTRIKALGEERRSPSWAEVNGIEVTARTVGLARGGA